VSTTKTKTKKLERVKPRRFSGVRRQASERTLGTGGAGIAMGTGGAAEAGGAGVVEGWEGGHRGGGGCHALRGRGRGE
jgi:hypothetical protein